MSEDLRPDYLLQSAADDLQELLNEFSELRGLVLLSAVLVPSLGNTLPLTVSEIEVGIGLSRVVWERGEETPDNTPGNFVTKDELRAEVADCVRFGLNPPGKTVTLTAQNEPVGRTLGCSDSAEFVTILENLNADNE